MEDVQCFGEEELIAHLRNVSMLKDPNVYPYENASISLERLSPDMLHHAQKYILTENLNNAKELRYQLKDRMVDMFNLNGFARMTFEEHTDSIDLLPVIIEEVITDHGKIYNVVADGAHRSYLSWVCGVNQQVVFIRGINKKTPYYSHVIDGLTFKDIDIFDEIPEGYIKKHHIISNNKTLFRNFNSVFENVGGSRKR